MIREYCECNKCKGKDRFCEIQYDVDPDRALMVSSEHNNSVLKAHGIKPKQT